MQQSFIQYAPDTFHLPPGSRATPRPPACRPLLQLSWAVFVGLSIRLIVAAHFYNGFLNPARDHWEFGYEIGHLARSIVMGQGFSSPYWGNTGSTAILTPVYPYLLAGIFATFGIFTKASAFMMLAVNCIFSAATAIPIFLIARKTFDEQTARLAAWVWAFFPYAINFSTTTMWYHSFVALLLTLLFLFALALQSRDGTLAWAGFGALFGFAALTNPVIVGIAPMVGIWLCIRLARQRKRYLKASATGLMAMVITILPWSMRNMVALHQNVLFKDGYWLEVCVGNLNESLHWWDGDQHPAGSDLEAARFQRMGESSYMAAKRREALGYIKNHPGRYAWRSLRHALFMWTGYWSLNRDYLKQEPFDPENILLATTLSLLAFAGLQHLFRFGHPRRGAALFGVVLLSFPIPYYLSHLDPGFRHPVDPLLVVLACSTFLRLSRRQRGVMHANMSREQFALQSYTQVAAGDREQPRHASHA